MNAQVMLLRRRWLLALNLIAVLSIVLSGCGGGGQDAPVVPAYLSPPAPVQGQTPLDPFSVVTLNYTTMYPVNGQPFSRLLQFADVHYPVPVSYQTRVTAPDGFDLRVENERATELWAEADPRIAIVSGAPVGNERIVVILVDKIIYQNLTNIIGLTTPVGTTSNPRYEVLVATLDPLTNPQVNMTNVDILKTLAHELGHVFGLGHSPDSHDLMHYKSNANQGLTPRTFLTLGDALAIWTALNNRAINWVASRPTVTPYAPAPQVTFSRDGRNTVAYVDANPEDIVCIYTRQP